MTKVSLLRRPVIAFVGAIITLALFAFMAQLINTNHPPQAKSEPNPTFEITQTIVETPAEPSRPEITPRQPLIEPVLPRQTISGGDGEQFVDTSAETIEIPTFSENYQTGPISADALPVVQVSPRYPISAAQSGKEGYVILGFDITEVGNVTNVKVLEANPKRVFNKSAIQAIKKWKYKPKIEEGKPVSQQNQQVQLDFTLEQQI